MGDIIYWDDDFNEKLESLQSLIAGLSTMSADQKESAIRSIEREIDAVNNTTRRTFMLELRQLDRSSKASYQTKLEGYDKKLTELKTELKWAKTNMQKNTLFDGAAERDQSANQLDRDKALDETEMIQAKTGSALQRTLQTINDATTIGAEVAETMAEQTEQIKRVDENLVNMESELSRADKLLRTMARRIMTDRLICIFVLLIFFGIVAILIYVAVNPDDDTLNVPDAAIPPF